MRPGLRVGRLLWAAWAAGLACCAQAAGPPRSVALVLSEDTAAYEEVVAGLSRELERAEPRPVLTRLPPDAARLAATEAEVIVAVGVKATQAAAAAAPRVPVLATLVPRAAFERIVREQPRLQEPRRFSAIYLDQPLARQLDLVRLALPRHTRLAALLGPGSREQERPLAAAARERQLKLAVEQVTAEGEVLPALKRLLDDSDALLALPDPLVFRSDTIQGVLLTSYRHHAPVIGFSQAYVRAGALAAVYSTPAQLGQQAGEALLREWGRGGALPPPRYPRHYSVAVNRHVARSLGLALPEEAELLEGLRRLEREP